MTIAAGVLYDGGVLICADTMMSRPTMSSYESKIIGCRFDGGVAIFAFAGNVGLAESAIQLCQEKLREAIVRPRRKSHIAKLVRMVLKEEYEEHVLKYPSYHADFDYGIIVVVWSKIDGLALYHTHHAALVESRRGYEFVGIGDGLTEYLFRSSYGGRHSEVTRVTALMAFAIAEVKNFMSSSVGGNVIMLRVSDAGVPSIVPAKSMDIVEHHSRVAHALLSSLPLHVVLSPDVDNFGITLDNIKMQLMHQWNLYSREAGSVIWASPPREAWELLTELNHPDVPRAHERPTGD